VTAFIKEIEVQDLRLAYDSKEVLHGITFDVYRNEILAVIGPAQSGKTSMLRCLNRTIEFTASATVSGTIRVRLSRTAASAGSASGFTLTNHCGESAGSTTLWQR
jgi:ABC-type phosphate transport system ATPase subunit